MSENGGPTLSPEVYQAHGELLEAFAAFMQAFGRASEVGIDAGAAIRQSLKQVMPAEAWEEMPPMLRMMLS